MKSVRLPFGDCDIEVGKLPTGEWYGVVHYGGKDIAYERRADRDNLLLTLGMIAGLHMRAAAARS